MAGALAVAALVLSGPLGWSLATIATLMLTSSAISFAAFGLRISDAETWESLKDGFTQGERDADFWSNLVSVGADFAGALPGVGAVGKGAYTGIRAAMRSTEASGVLQRAAIYGAKTMDEAKAIADLKNPLIARAVRGLSDPEKAANAVAGASGLTGVGTGGFGLYNKAVDADDDGIKDGTVAGIDGSRLVLDNGGIFKLFGHVF